MVFGGQEAWAASSSPDAIWTGYARGAGLDMEKWGGCVREGRHRAAIEADRRLGASLGVNATPTVFVGRAKLVGVPGYEELAEVVRAELGRN